MTIRVDVVSHEQMAAFVAAASVPFSFDPTQDEVDSIAQIDRLLGAFAGNAIVGTTGSIVYPVTVPGGARLLTAGVTFVSVSPTHRRRGVLTSMMRRVIDEAHERGEPLSSLWASEARIYGRFGYGQGVESVSVEVKRADAALTVRAELEGAGDIRLIDGAEALRLLPPFHDSVDWVGKFWRSQEYWENWALWDPDHDRDGHTKRRIAVYEIDGVVDGYTFFRTKRGEERRVRVDELVTGSVPAAVALYRFLFGIDLTDVLHFRTRRVDEPVRWMLTDNRAWRRTGSEYMWFRLVDLEASLAARTYTTGGRLVIEVSDDFAPWNRGRWALEGDETGAVCRRADDSADVHLDTADLGALYMGGRSAHTLAAAGRITGEAASIALLDRMFRTAEPPWSPETY